MNGMTALVCTLVPLLVLLLVKGIVSDASTPTTVSLSSLSVRNETATARTFSQNRTIHRVITSKAIPMKVYERGFRFGDSQESDWTLSASLPLEDMHVHNGQQKTGLQSLPLVTVRRPIC